jgi:hypothetical protein
MSDFVAYYDNKRVISADHRCLVYGPYSPECVEEKFSEVREDDCNK